jgi:ATP-binding cassette subfamily C protein LapB
MLHFDTAAGFGVQASREDLVTPRSTGPVSHQHWAKTNRSFWALIRDALAFQPSAIIATLFINLFGLALPLAVLQIFDRVLHNQSFNTLTLLLALLVLVVLAETALRFARDTLVSRMALVKGFDLNLQALGRLLAAPRSRLASLSPRQTLDALSAPDDLAAFFGGNARLALLDFPFVVLFLGMIWLIAGPVAALPALLIVIFAGWTIWASGKLKKTMEEQIRGEHERFGFYKEALAGIATVKSLSIEPQMQRRLERILRNTALNNYALVLQSNRMLTMAQLYSSLTMISVASLGGLLAIRGDIGLGAVAACTLIANRVSAPVLRMISVWGQFEAAQLARERAAPLIALPVAAPATRPEGPAEIRLEEVAMGPRGQGEAGLAFQVARGESLGLAIPKTHERLQLIAMLRGLLPPDHGRIFYDDVDLYASGGAAEGVFAIEGEPVIFNGTILDNVSMFRSGVEQINAVTTLRRLGLEQAIKQLPEGYDTKLGDQAVNTLPLDFLRGIVLARAVAARPRVLLVCLPPLGPADVVREQFRRACEALRGISTIIRIVEHPADVENTGRTLVVRNWTAMPAEDPASTRRHGASLLTALAAAPKAAQTQVIRHD